MLVILFEPREATGAAEQPFLQSFDHLLASISFNAFCIDAQTGFRLT